MNCSAPFLKWVTSNNKICTEISELCNKYQDDSEDGHKCFTVGKDGIQYIVCKICGNYKQTNMINLIPTKIKCRDPNHFLEEQLLGYEKKMEAASSRINALVMTKDRTTKFWNSFQLKTELDEMQNLLELWTSDMKWWKQQK